MVATCPLAEMVDFRPEHWHALRGRLHHDHLSRMEAVGSADEVFAHALRVSCLTRTVLLDGRPEAIMGCGLMPDAGYPWLAKTDVAMTRFWRVIRAAPAFIAECLQHRPVLRAEVPPDDKVVARWLLWLGFRAVGPGMNDTLRWEISRGR